MNNANHDHRERCPARDRLILREHQLTAVEFVNYFASIDTRWSILDIGCADGFFLEILRNLGFQRIYGMDQDSECLDIARQKGLSVFEGSIYQLDAQGQIDAVLMIDMMEHLDNPGLAITKIYDALKGDGILYLITPVVEQLPSRFWSKVMKLWVRHKPDDEQGLSTTDSICWLLRSHQFEIDAYVRTAADMNEETEYSQQWLSLIARKLQPARLPELIPTEVQTMPPPPPVEVTPEVEDESTDDVPTVIESTDEKQGDLPS